MAILLGIWNCVGILVADTPSLLSGLWQVVAGFICICCEAPCCCMFVEHVQRASDWVERRPYWNKAAAYVLWVNYPTLLFSKSFSSVLLVRLFGVESLFLLQNVIVYFYLYNNLMPSWSVKLFYDKKQFSFYILQEYL